ncbi:MAG: hypothetical protein GY749_19305 [Desulfobacteraceae bacterium]|nr:hypothetical protein [Desulfobacteraceae bacterium]
MKKKIVYYSVIIVFFICSFSAALAGDIIPANLAKPVTEISKNIDSDRDLICTSTHAQVRVENLSQPFKVTFQDYTELVRELHLKNPNVPPSVLGAVRIISDINSADFLVTVPLIKYVQPNSELEVVTPNFTGTAWAASNLTATAGDDGFYASFRTKKQGSYAIINPERKEYIRKKTKKRKVRLEKQPRNDEPWGLHSENGRSPDKIPLILVHGDNSFKEKEDRWKYFLDWTTDNQEFDNKYEIWRFHHNTEELIGFDGKSGNSLELGNAINEQFGDTPVLLLAHSRGGLVSRTYMCKYGDGNEGDRVLGLVTLATPHHGSPGAVPEWGLETIKGKFKDTELAEIMFGMTADAVVNVMDIGTMGLAWDNFDGPENGIRYSEFSMESKIGTNHVLSLMDANVKNPILEDFETDNISYIPDRAFGTMEELNSDTRYFGKIIAYGGYDKDLGAGGHDPFNWLDLSFADHAGLELATYMMADMVSKKFGEDSSDSSDSSGLHYIANDGMVPLQSALFLKKAPEDEPMYEIEESQNWFSADVYEVRPKDFSNRMNFRKAVLCPDYDHLHMVEAKGGLLSDKTDYWDHVASSLNELAALPDDSSQEFTPEVEEISDSLPSFSSIASGGNCFIQTLAPVNFSQRRKGAKKVGNEVDKFIP